MDINIIKPYCSAIILAGGSGTRFSSDTTKQNIQVGGVPVLVRSIMSFSECRCINEIVVVGRSDELFMIENYKTEYSLEKIIKIVAGGETRQKSALCGLDRISEKAKFVAIHDAARCLVTPEMIEKTVKQAYKSGAAIAAMKAVSTVKTDDGSGNIASTPDREKIWLAATPQVFMADIYRAAAYTAKQDNIEATDDASLCERLGFKVSLVDCGSENIKITTPVDIYTAEAILRYRAEKAVSK